MGDAKYVIYPILGILALWVLWYLSGGPLHNYDDKKYVFPAENGLEYSKDFN